MNLYLVLIFMITLVDIPMHAYNYRIFNRTRGTLRLKFNLRGTQSKTVNIAPESYKKVEIGGLRAAHLLESISISGQGDVFKGLQATYKPDIEAGRKDVFISHKGIEYHNAKGNDTAEASGKNYVGDINATTVLRLAMKPGSGKLVVHERK